MNRVQNRRFIDAEKRFNSRYYIVLVTALLSFVIYYTFLLPTTIGTDRRFVIYVFLLPVFIGSIVLGFIYKPYVVVRVSTALSFVERMCMVGLYTVIIAVSSLAIFGQAAYITWNIYNAYVAKQSYPQQFIQPVTRIWLSRSPYHVEFKFNGKNEKLDASYKTLSEYAEKDLNNYNVAIQAHQGIWGYYVVDSWQIVAK